MTDDSGARLKDELYRLIQTDPRVFEFLQEGSLDGLWYWDAESPHEEWMSPRFKEVFGYADDEIPNNADWWQENIHPEDRALALENLEKHLADPGHPYDQVVRYRHKDGSTVWVRCRGVAIRDENGKPIRVLGAHTDLTDLKKAERTACIAQEKLKESERRFRLLFEQAPSAYQSLDNDGRIIIINQAWLDMLGYRYEDVIGQEFQDFLVEAHFVEEHFPEFKKAGEISLPGTFMRCKDGSTKIVHIEGRIGYDAEGDFLQTHCILTDITERRRADEALREAHESLERKVEERTEELRLYETIVSHASDFLSIIGRDYVYRLVSPAYLRAFARKRDEIIGHHARDVLGQDYFENHSKPNLDRAFAGESLSYQAWIDTPGLGRRFIETQYAPVRDTEGAVTHVVIAAHDMTETKEVQESLADAQHMAHLGNWEWDLEADTFKGSEECYRLIDREPDEFGHRLDSLLEIVHPDDREQVELAMKGVFEGAPYDVEHRVVWKDGSIRHLHAQATVVFGKDGRPASLRGTVQDITEAVQARSHLIQVSKLASLGEMATGVAHELNQPLNIIRMAADGVNLLMEEGEVPRDFLKTRMDWIADQTVRAATIIDHLRIFGRKASEEMEPISPRDAILNATGFIQEQLRLHGIDLELDLPEACRPVTGHIIHLEQVIMNLLTNARDAIEGAGRDGGRGSIRVRIDDDPGSGEIRLMVEDDGGGIPPEALPNIFDPFFTTKEIGKGTGVGLSISYGIIAEMGGTITAENANGGARFTISLPVARNGS